MKFWITIALSCLFMLSCSSNSEGAEVNGEKTTTNSDEKESKEIIKLKDNQYIEYYPDTENIKFKGEIDENGERMGRWVHYSITGKELNSSEYMHGELHGVSVVRHPNGAIHYVGEYDMGKKIGKWVFRNEDGSVKYEEDYGSGEEK